MRDRFAVRIDVRSYELDVNGRVNHANYHRYGEHARTEHLRAAGCSLVTRVAHGLGLVMLETRVSFRRELRDGDQLEVDSRMLLDAATRRLVPDPRARLAAVATDVGLLGPP